MTTFTTEDRLNATVWEPIPFAGMVDVTDKSGEPMTLQEIADVEGVSHQAVSEIVDRACRKLRKALEARGIKLEDLL